jgi:hypothetical protein
MSWRVVERNMTLEKFWQSKKCLAVWEPDAPDEPN